MQHHETTKTESCEGCNEDNINIHLNENRLTKCGMFTMAYCIKVITDDMK
jgi:hypothetical protein